MSRWFGFRSKDHAPVMMAEEEDEALVDVENALLQLLNDDIETANKILKEKNSSFHQVGRGMSAFIASMLASEKELLKEAANILATAEARAWEDMKRAQKESAAFRSEIYPPGTEYLLCYAVAQLQGAICAVLLGSVTEAIKGFYKLRKAFSTLDSIMDTESKYLERKLGSSTTSLATSSERPQPAHPSELSEDPDESNLMAHGASQIPGGFDEDSEDQPGVLRSVDRAQSRLLEVDPASVGFTSHTDIFIHSGTRLCYGTLLLVFSMIENPMFSRILYIVGFKGDRERGTRYLWQAARFNNFNSAIAGIALLGYYNGIIGFCDILPTDPGADDDLTGYPRGRCRALLSDMRTRYPASRLWKMEEARMHAYDRNAAEAVRILSANSDSTMKQIAVINMFEMSLTTMFLHDYELSAKSWQKCTDLSQWSPTLYAYLTGCCYLELYRNSRIDELEKAEKYKKLATDYFRKGPPLAGRQKVMSKELPFDTYVCRKVNKWEERASAWGLALADVVGVSPLTEMIYFWGGAKKENHALLQKSLDAIEWSRTTHPLKFEKDLDETAIKALLEACMLRNMGKYSAARSILQNEIMNHERHEFKGHLKDDFTLPAAHYEMACLAWHEKDLPNTTPAEQKAKVLECETWLEKTHRWEQYVLDTRVSIKLTTSFVTVRRYKDIMGI